MLTRLECLQILELGAAANTYEIETRYTMMIKRYHGKSDPETVQRLNQITMAYNILTGRYVEPEPENPRLDKIVFGKSRRQWQNIWHYGRFPLLVGAICAAFAIYLIISIATNKPPDFQFAVTGFFYTTDDTGVRVDQYIKEILPGTEKVEYQLIPIDLRNTGPTEAGETTASSVSADYQSQYAYLMKLVAMMAGDSIEVYICDQYVYNNYSAQGAYADLGELYERLKDLPPDILAKIKPQRRYPADDSGDDLTSETTAATIPIEEANKDLSLPITGLDVSELHLTEGLGIYSDTQILTIGIKAGDPAKTADFLEKWIRDYQKMHQMQKEYEDAAKAAAASEAAASNSEAGATTASSAA
jgi:hypothetical protein